MVQCFSNFLRDISFLHENKIPSLFYANKSSPPFPHARRNRAPLNDTNRNSLISDKIQGLLK